MSFFKKKHKKSQTPQGSSKNFKFIPTWKLKLILDSPNCTGIDGCDYGPWKEELEQILFERNNRLQEWELRKTMHGLDQAIKAMSEKSNETAKLPSDWLDRTEAFSEINDFWKIKGPNGFSYEILAIPPLIMAF